MDFLFFGLLTFLVFKAIKLWIKWRIQFYKREIKKLDEEERIWLLEQKEYSAYKKQLHKTLKSNNISHDNHG